MPSFSRTLTAAMIAVIFAIVPPLILESEALACGNGRRGRRPARDKSYTDCV